MGRRFKSRRLYQPAADYFTRSSSTTYDPGGGRVVVLREIQPQIFPWGGQAIMRHYQIDGGWVVDDVGSAYVVTDVFVPTFAA